MVAVLCRLQIFHSKPFTKTEAFICLKTEIWKKKKVGFKNLPLIWAYAISSSFSLQIRSV